jgi:hypothetical protein
MVQDGCIYIEKLNGPFLYVDRGTPAEYAAGLARAIELGWLELHDSGTFVRALPRKDTVPLRSRCIRAATFGTGLVLTRNPPACDRRALVVAPDQAKDRFPRTRFPRLRHW